MKKSKFTEEQIAYALRQVEGGWPARPCGFFSPCREGHCAIDSGVGWVIGFAKPRLWSLAVGYENGELECLGADKTAAPFV